MKDFNQKLTRPLQLRKRRDKKGHKQKSSKLLLLALGLILLCAVAVLTFLLSEKITEFLEWFRAV